MHLTKKILLAIMPLSGWICLFLSIPFFFLPVIADSSFQFIGFLLLNYFVFRLSTPFIIVLHELGHWIAGRMVGEHPARIVFGSGHLLLRTTFFNTKVNIHYKISSGYILCIFKNNRNLSLRSLIYILGGPIINMTIGLLIIYTIPFTVDLGSHIALTLFFGYFQVLVGLFNLIPHKINLNGFKTDSDGFQIWKIIRGTSEGNNTELALNHFFEGEDYFNAKSYPQAIQEFQRCLDTAQSLSADAVNAIHINMGACYHQLEQYDKSSEILVEAERKLTDQPNSPLLAVIYSLYAWKYIMEDDIKQATVYGKKSFDILYELEDIRLVWGILLVENQEWHDAEYMLKPLVEFGYLTGRSILAAAYLVPIYHHRNQDKKKARYLSFAQRHVDQLDKQDLLVYQRVFAMINSSSAQSSILDIASH